MGALNILDRNVQPDFMISDAQRFAKEAHESRQIETSEAFKRAHHRWQQRTIEWNVDTIAMGFMDPQNLQAIVAEEERIGIKPVEPTFAPPISPTLNTEKETWTRPRSKSTSSKRWPVKSSWP